jgi:HK97 family phage prohead protease
MDDMEKKVMCEMPLLNIKSLKRGEFIGWGSTGDIDRSGERIWPGAFKRTVKNWEELGQFPPILREHDLLKGHIGICKFLEVKNKGLHVHAKLFIDDIPLARKVYEEFMSGVQYAMSVGFSKAKSYMQDGIRQITDLDLMEISLVQKPCNQKATVEDIKADHDPTDRSLIQPLERLIGRIRNKK